MEPNGASRCGVFLGEEQAADIGIICIKGLLGLMLMRVGLRNRPRT